MRHGLQSSSSDRISEVECKLCCKTIKSPEVIGVTVTCNFNMTIWPLPTFQADSAFHMPQTASHCTATLPVPYIVTLGSTRTRHVRPTTWFLASSAVLFIDISYCLYLCVDCVNPVWFLTRDCLTVPPFPVFGIMIGMFQTIAVLYNPLN